MANPKFEIYQGKDDQYYFRLKAGNGETTLTGEGYKAKQGCKNGIESVKKNAPEDANYEKKEGANGKFYFNLKAKNGEIIGSSQGYASLQSRDKGIESIKRDAPSAEILD